MQTILGANGTIATELAKSLTRYTTKIRLVSRTPKKVNETDEVLSADLLNAEQTLRAVEGSEVVYLTAGLTYDTKIWQTQWPLLMKNVIAACENTGAKLVFFSNVYSLGKVNGGMTEESPMKPSSKKGIVRAQVEQMILDEVAAGRLTAIIARAADFYGPNTPLSFANVMILENLKKGKAAQLFVGDSYRHSFTYTPDAGLGTAMLGNTPEAFNQIWNLPTHKAALTGKEFVQLSAEALDVKPRIQILPKLMVRIAGFFVGVIRESYEMIYQNDSDYLFDSTKFEKAFGFEPTTYQEGIKKTAASLA